MTFNHTMYYSIWNYTETFIMACLQRKFTLEVNLSYLQMAFLVPSFFSLPFFFILSISPLIIYFHLFLCFSSIVFFFFFPFSFYLLFWYLISDSFVLSCSVLFDFILFCFVLLDVSSPSPSSILLGLWCLQLCLPSTERDHGSIPDRNNSDTTTYKCKKNNNNSFLSLAECLSSGADRKSVV